MTLIQMPITKTPRCSVCQYAMSPEEVSTICDLCRAEKDACTADSAEDRPYDPMEMPGLTASEFYKWVDVIDTMVTPAGMPTEMERCSKATVVEKWRAAYRSDEERIKELYEEYGIPKNTALVRVIGRDSEDDPKYDLNADGGFYSDHFHIRTPEGAETEAYTAAQVDRIARNRRIDGEEARRAVCKDPQCTAEPARRRDNQAYRGPSRVKYGPGESKSNRLLKLRREAQPESEAHRPMTNGSHFYTDHFHIRHADGTIEPEPWTQKQVNSRTNRRRNAGETVSMWVCRLPNCDKEPKRRRHAKAYQAA